MRRLTKSIFQFLWAVLLYWVIFPYADTPSLLETLCYQFVCEYPLTEIPKHACNWCEIIGFLAFALTTIWIISIIWGLTKSLLAEIKAKKEIKKGESSEEE